MSSVYVYTPCKDKKYEECINYAGFSLGSPNNQTCDNCIHNHEYSVLSVKPYKDYYVQRKNKPKPKRWKTYKA